jgi:hypothetical protein
MELGGAAFGEFGPPLATAIGPRGIGSCIIGACAYVPTVEDKFIKDSEEGVEKYRTTKKAAIAKRNPTIKRCHISETV